MNSPILEIRNLSAAYGGHTVLHDVNLTVGERDYIGIVGPNGGGKTTLLKCILGLLKPTGGSITFTSHRMPGAQPTIGYLPQYNRIDPKFPITVEEVVLSGLSCRKSLMGRFTDEQRDRARQTLARIGMESLADRPIGALSGGQLQRVLLGRAVVADPELLILDEPNTYIDKRFEEQLYRQLALLNHECAILLVSHDVNGVRREAGTVVCVNRTLRPVDPATLSEAEAYDNLAD